MRPFLVLLALAAPASADRSANFSATTVGDAAGVTLVHGKKTWSMVVDKQTIETTEPSQHGDYYVFVPPGHKQIAWIRNGDVDGSPVGKDVAVQFYSANGKGATVRFGELFSDAELKNVKKSTSGWRWIVDEPLPVKAMLTLRTEGAPVVIDAAAGTASRNRSTR